MSIKLKRGRRLSGTTKVWMNKFTGLLAIKRSPTADPRISRLIHFNFYEVYEYVGEFI